MVLEAFGVGALSGTAQRPSPFPSRSEGMSLIRRRAILRLPFRSYEESEASTFLKAEDELWRVDFRLEDNWGIWAASSTVTGMNWGGTTYNFQLDITLSLNQAIDSLMENITMKIPQHRIYQLEELRDSIRVSLEGIGYGSKSPECLLSASRRGETFKIVLTQVGRGRSIVLDINEFDVNKNDSIDGLMEEMSEGLFNGELTVFNITNVTEFLDEYRELLREILEDS